MKTLLAHLLALTSFFISTTVFAQLGEMPMPAAQQQGPQGPSMEETKRWIADKVNKLSVEVFPDSKHYIVFHGCEFALFAPRDTPARPSTSYVLTGPIRVVDLDENIQTIPYNKPVPFTKYDPPELRLKLIGGTEISRFSSMWEGKNQVAPAAIGAVWNGEFDQYIAQVRARAQPNETVYAEIGMPDNDSLLSLANGFKHLIKLCAAERAAELHNKPAKKDLF